MSDPKNRPEGITVQSPGAADESMAGNVAALARYGSAPSRKPVSTPIRRKGVVTIPQQVREQLRLEEGDSLIVEIEDGRIVLTPAAPPMPRDQAWFWTPEWQAKEAEADADRAAGRVTHYDSDAEFLASFGED